jgi:hypothetical protein
MHDLGWAACTMLDIADVFGDLLVCCCHGETRLNA